jgi:hypothetical protein
VGLCSLDDGQRKRMFDDCSTAAEKRSTSSSL